MQKYHIITKNNHNFMKELGVILKYDLRKKVGHIKIKAKINHETEQRYVKKRK